MDYQIVFSSDLKVGADEFVKEWNSGESNPGFADIPKKSGSSKKFGILPDQVTVILSAVAIGVTSNLITDLIKIVIERICKNKKKDPHVIVKITGPNGSPIKIEVSTSDSTSGNE